MVTVLFVGVLCIVCIVACSNGYGIAVLCVCVLRMMVLFGVCVLHPGAFVCFAFDGLMFVFCL